MENHEEHAKQLIENVKNNTNGAYDAWLKVKPGDVDEHIAWVKKALNLQDETVTEADLRAMHEHAKTGLQSEVKEMRAKRPDIPTVGELCVAEDHA